MADVWFSVDMLHAVEAEVDMPTGAQTLLKSLGDARVLPKALLLAVETGRLHVAKCLLDYGCTPEVSDLLGRTAVYYAPPDAPWFRDMVDLLLRYGCRQDTRFSPMGLTFMQYIVQALRSGCRRDVQTVIEFLVSRGFDIDQPDDAGRTALTVATSPWMADILLAAGADLYKSFTTSPAVRQLVRDGHPALWSFYASKHWSAIKILPSGHSPLSVAVSGAYEPFLVHVAHTSPTMFFAPCTSTGACAYALAADALPDSILKRVMPLLPCPGLKQLIGQTGLGAAYCSRGAKCYACKHRLGFSQLGL